MMICGEDLGMMADCVTSVMNELGILSLEIQRAPKIDTIEFFHPADAKYPRLVLRWKRLKTGFSRRCGIH